MTIRNIPAAPEVTRRSGVQSDISPRALESWNPAIRAASEKASDNVITIYEQIGYDWWTGEGVTAKRIAAALRSIGPGNDVVVNINSPGGDVFEGLAIYNLLREHDGGVTVNIVGLAASAASFIAMSGDDIRIGRAAFFMIHNAWVFAAGNRNDLRDIADWLEPFDTTIADIYSTRTGIEQNEVMPMMDSEKWIGGKEAVDSGWADDFLNSDLISQEDSDESDSKKAAAKLDSALVRAGISRSERKTLMQDFKSSMTSSAGGGKPSATATDKPGAVAHAVSASLSEAKKSLNSVIEEISHER